MKSERIKLIRVISAIVPPGVPETTEKSRYVFCVCRSAGLTAFYSAREEGMRADYVVTMYGFEYNGEEIAEFRGKRYVIDRQTMLVKGPKIEVTLKEALGVGS